MEKGMENNNHRSNNEAASQYYSQIQNSIKSIFELTTRVDERVQLMMKKQEDVEWKIDGISTEMKELSTRVTVLESNNGKAVAAAVSTEVDRLKDTISDMKLKIQTLESKADSSEGKWKTVLNFGLQILWVVVAAYLLYRLGIQAPEVP